jgi:hypothetical protein
MRQARTHTCAPSTSAKLKSLQDLSIRVNPEVTKEGIHHASLWVDGSLHLHLHMCKDIDSSLELSDPFYRALSLVNAITDVPLQWSVPVRVPDRGRGFSLEARLGVSMRGVVTSTHMVTRVANPIPSVPLELLRVSLQCSHGLLCYLRTSSPVSARWSCTSPIRSNCSVRLSQEYSWRAGLGNRMALWTYSMDIE